MMKRAGVLAMAVALFAFLAPSAQADIILYEDYSLAAVLGPVTAELAFVETETGDSTLDFFAKQDALLASLQCGTGVGDCLNGNLTVTKTNLRQWDLEWDTNIWDIKYILVKDGACSGSNCDIPGHLYTLYAVTTDQFRDGGGSVQVPSVEFCSGDIDINGNCPRGVSHLTVFGTRGTNVPEPTTLLLLGAGLIGMMSLGRRLR